MSFWSSASRSWEHGASPEGADAYKSSAAVSKTLVVLSTDARLGFVAASKDEATALLDQAVGMLQARSDVEVWEHPRGIWYRRSVSTGMALVALFPGQGAQYLGMERSRRELSSRAGSDRANGQFVL